MSLLCMHSCHVWLECISFLSLHCLMVCASFRLVPSKTLQCSHGYAPRQSSGKTKDEEKVLIIGHKRSIEGFQKQLLPWLRTRGAETKRAVFLTLTLLRAATTKEFDTIARLETQAMHTTMHTTTVEMTHDLKVYFNEFAPFGKEDTAKELQDHAARTQDTLVNAVENVEVAGIERAVFRALTRLRAATIKFFYTIARLETQAIDAYNDALPQRGLAPSGCCAIAQILERCSHTNGSPQNTLVPGIADLAEKHNVFIAGDGLKPGQTKTKSALVLFFVGANIKPDFSPHTTTP